jgi:hypothetical protein
MAGTLWLDSLSNSGLSLLGDLRIVNCGVQFLNNSTFKFAILKDGGARHSDLEILSGTAWFGTTSVTYSPQLVGGGAIANGTSWTPIITANSAFTGAGWFSADTGNYQQRENGPTNTEWWIVYIV